MVVAVAAMLAVDSVVVAGEAVVGAGASVLGAGSVMFVGAGAGVVVAGSVVVPPQADTARSTAIGRTRSVICPAMFPRSFPASAYALS